MAALRTLRHAGVTLAFGYGSDYATPSSMADWLSKSAAKGRYHAGLTGFTEDA
jgi:hypothetical protein